MSTNANKELVRRYTDEAYRRANPAICDELLAPSVDDVQGEKEFVRQVATAFGNRQYTILELLGEGDRVAWIGQFKGTHQGEFLGVAATGSPVVVEAMAYVRIADGKIVEFRGYWDRESVREQLTAVTATDKTAL